MKLSKIQISNFQSFKDSGQIEFEDGFNLIVGENNSGKSSLLRTLQPGLKDDRNRSLFRWEPHTLPQPEVILTMIISGEEYRDIILRNSINVIAIPGDETADSYLKRVFLSEKIRIEIRKSPGYFQKPKIFDGENKILTNFCYVHNSNGEFIHAGSTSGDNYNNSAIEQTISQRNIFFFSAERLSIGESGYSHSERLSANADNLPAVLQTLQGERGDIFDVLVENVREIFSTVGNISVGPNHRNNSEILIWPTKEKNRRELSFSLNNSGTGVAQVIAILTAIMTIENAVIVVDEINSFLHPAAVKTLLRILQTDYSQHQYIISTHSPEVISFSNPSTVHLVKRSGYESAVQRLDLNQIDGFREVADHLGISMADVFAADNVIWVEGPTEELCFPLVYSHSTKRTLPRGTAFISVVATGDLSRKKRDRQLVGEIYERLSSTGSPLVKSVKFGFDSEQLSEAEKEDMRKESKGRMHFLPRRHFECYLLDPFAITAFLHEKDGQSDGSHTSELVSEKLTELASSPKFSLSEWNGDLSNEAWLEKVDAAKLIAETCKALSEQRVTFNKKADSLFLLKHILEKNPNSLKSLTDYVCELVDGK